MTIFAVCWAWSSRNLSWDFSRNWIPFFIVAIFLSANPGSFFREPELQASFNSSRSLMFNSLYRSLTVFGPIAGMSSRSRSSGGILQSNSWYAVIVPVVMNSSIFAMLDFPIPGVFSSWPLSRSVSISVGRFEIIRAILWLPAIRKESSPRISKISAIRLKSSLKVVFCM